ncbi:hypothetical protein BH11ACT3_BH11ACT3_15910 [soil metagenome]
MSERGTGTPGDALTPTVLPAGTPLPAQPAERRVESTTPASTAAAASRPKNRRPRKGWDIGVSIMFLLLSYVAFSVGAVLGVLAIAFFTGCNSSGCGTGDTPYIGAVTLAALAVIGTLATVTLLVFRRRGWWLAAATFATMVLGWIIINALTLAG